MGAVNGAVLKLPPLLYLDYNNRGLGGEPINFMAKPGWFRPLYVILEIWQTFGYSAIIYIAAMMNIDPSLYEAAEVDGANRWDKILRITLPCISTSVIVMLIISVGNIFTVNLDRILLMYNSSVYDTADEILVSFANKMADKFAETRLF